jgi:hypothetical protein
MAVPPFLMSVLRSGRVVLSTGLKEVNAGQLPACQLRSRSHFGQASYPA